MVDKTVMRYLKKRIDTKMDKELSSKQPPFGELVADVARTMALRTPYCLLPTPYSLLGTEVRALCSHFDESEPCDRRGTNTTPTHSAY